MGIAYLYGAGGGGVPTDEMTNPAVASDVYSGETFITKGSDDLVVGTVPDKTTNHVQTLNQKWIIPAGYHDGTGKVTQNLTYVGKQTASIGNNGNVAINRGYHDGTGKVTAVNDTHAGGAVYPTTSSRTISTNGRVLQNKLYIPAQPNLIASNIVRGKSIFGVSGSFDTIETIYRDQRVYNGSAFSGLFSGGVLTKVHPRYISGSKFYSDFNDAPTENFRISSGSLYCTAFHRYSGEDYAALCLVPRAINFSKISKVRFTGVWNFAVHTINTGARITVTPFIRINSLTKSGDSVTVNGTSRSVALCGTWIWTPNSYDESWGSSGDISFDAECDVSNLTGNAFLEIAASPGRGAVDDNKTFWPGVSLVINGIWLYT